MESKWSDSDARSIISSYSKKGVCEDLALRVYTSRLIGGMPQLVIHGGGNTSVKTRLPDFLGREGDVICVKGSGWDLDTIEPAGLPALQLEPLRAVRSRDHLTDEEMTAFLRSHLLSAASPNPSVETLLHAFLPHKFVDHSHASAVLSLSDQADGGKLVREALGERVAVIPYIMPGFGLAKAVADAYEAAPHVEGVVLGKHGLFTFGETARLSYERMIDLVDRAERFIDRAPRWRPTPRRDLGDAAQAFEIAPIIRGAAAVDCGGGAYDRFVTDFRTSPEILKFVNGADVEDYGARGVITPDHVIRTKAKYLIAAPPRVAELDDFRSDLFSRSKAYQEAYQRYFNDNNQRAGGGKRMLDPAPRIVLAPGVGLFGLGRTRKDARIAADLAELSIEAIDAAERIGAFEPLGAADIFDMEYWSLEQAKLGKAAPKPLAGQIAVITGGAGAIGSAVAALFAANGAAVAIFDLDQERAAETARRIGGDTISIRCDVTDEKSVKLAFSETLKIFGGVDVLVSNAGAAFEGPIAELDDRVLRASFDLNFFAHQRMAKSAVEVMKAQGTGGALLFNVSKQAINPGENFGAYGLAKAATLFLVRQYALECARFGIRSNAVNADRVRSGLLNDALIDRRAEARKLTREQYLAGNLLNREVTADDVAQAFLHHAVSLKTTGDVTTVDGGNVAAMLR